MKTYHLIIDDFIGRWGYSKQLVRSVLANYHGKQVDVCISSLGGDLDHGLSIMQLFKDHGNVTVYLSGFVASAATIAAMGAKRICMSKYAMFLVHKCSNFIDAWGNYNADQMQQLIDDLTANKKENNRIDVVIAQLYAAKCGKSINEILAVLKEGKWLTAQQALEMGFIDEITEEAGSNKQNLTPQLRQKLNVLGITMEGLCEAEEGDNRSMLRQILDGIKALARGMNAPETKTNKIDQPKMETTAYTAIMDALTVSSLNASADGSVSLTAEQMQTVEDRFSSMTADIAQRDATIAERDATISQLNAQVEALQKLPGDDTKDNLDDTGRGELTEEEMYNLANSFFD